MERIGAQGVAIVVSIILQNILGTNGYGKIVLIMAITAIMQVLVDSGLGNALIQKKDADHLDFENRPEDFASITDKIDAELYGLFK